MQKAMQKAKSNYANAKSNYFKPKQAIHKPTSACAHNRAVF